MNESVVFGILMLNLLHSKSQFSLRQRKSTHISLLEQVLGANTKILKRIQKEAELGNELNNFIWVFFSAFVIIIVCIIFLPKVNYLFWFYALIIIILEIYFFIILLKNIYFSFAKTKNFIIIKIINKFQISYNYSYYDDFALKPSDKELKELRELDNKLKTFKENEREKDKVTILSLKNYFSKDDLMCIKNDFCYAKSKQDKNFQGFTEIFSIILVSSLVLILISIIPKLQELLEKQSYNGIFGSSILIFIFLPICKYFLAKTPPTIEIYDKCISLLDRAIN